MGLVLIIVLRRKGQSSNTSRCSLQSEHRQEWDQTWTTDPAVHTCIKYHPPTKDKISTISKRLHLWRPVAKDPSPQPYTDVCLPCPCRQPWGWALMMRPIPTIMCCIQSVKADSAYHIAKLIWDLLEQPLAPRSPRSSPFHHFLLLLEGILEHIILYLCHL